MKIAVHGDPRVLDDPVDGFPFYFLEHEVVPPAEADHIFMPFPAPITSEVNSHASQEMTTVEYQQHKKKYVTWSLCDFPSYSLRMAGTKFLLSPMEGRALSEHYHCHAMPAHPCAGDYRIAMDLDWTKECRDLEKKYRFAFLGWIDAFPYEKYGGRAWMRQVQTRVGGENFFIRGKRHNALWPGWLEAHKEWMQRMGEAYYAFCPCGGGDATMDPRLYWSMQVGCVPIIFDAEYLAFDDVVDWEKLAIFPKDKMDFDYMALPTGEEYEEKRKAVMSFWDEYCFYPNCAKKLAEHYL